MVPQCLCHKKRHAATCVSRGVASVSRGVSRGVASIEKMLDIDIPSRFADFLYPYPQIFSGGNLNEIASLCVEMLLRVLGLAEHCITNPFRIYFNAARQQIFVHAITLFRLYRPRNTAA